MTRLFKTTGSLATFLLVGAAWGTSVAALEYVTIKRNGQTTKVAGKLQVEAVDGGVLLLAPDGELWAIPVEEIVRRETDDKPFEPLARAAMNRRLLAQHPGFKLHQTAHYTICYNTSQAYAQWIGALYERLYDGYYNFWSRRGVKLSDPELPLVAVVFDTRENYALFARHELGESVENIIGYYSLRSNQVTTYDLTGIEGLGGRQRGANAARINAMLSQPTAERNVATIVHEATHQLVFNSGLQTRYADVPFWVSEGLAMYFETPDLESSKGWKKIGGVNRYNLMQFRNYLKDRPADSLETLLTDDRRFRDAATARQAYGEAWALNYFLFKTKGNEYADYLKQIAKLEPLVELEATQRVAMFQAAFGADLAQVEADFLKYMRSVE
jgi:hypothetical protein